MEIEPNEEFCGIEAALRACAPGADWRALQERGRESTSQAIGRAAWRAGLEGLIVPSHARARGSNAVLFPENLRPGSRIDALE